LIPLLISIFIIAMAIFLYHKKPTRILLRIFPLILIYLLIINFALEIKLKSKLGPPILLIDASMSMARYLSEIEKKVSAIKFDHLQFFFSEGIYHEPPDTLGKFTDITTALLKVNEFKPSAILLISDGNHNYGDTPLSKIEYLDTPIYSFGIGPESLRDLSIVDVSYPEYIFKGDTIKIEVIVESEGFGAGNGEVILKFPHTNYELKKDFPLGDIRAKNRIEFTVMTKEIGANRFRISLTPQPKEINYENNEVNFYLDILQKRIEVLYYTDHLSFNTKFILRALLQDEYIELLPMGRSTPNSYTNLGDGRQVTALPALDKFDVLILDNINFSLLPRYNFKGHLHQGKGILFIGSIEGLNENLQEILPIDITNSIMKGEFHVKVTQPFSLLTPEEEYPPTFVIHRVLGIKSNTNVIAVTDNRPVIAYRNYENGLVFQINFLDLGNWQFSQRGLKSKELLFPLLSDIVRLLSPYGKKNRLILKSLSKDYKIGETINLRLESFDRDFKLKSGGDFYLQFNNERIPFFELKSGIYEATFIAKNANEFEIVATGHLDGETLKSNSIKIRIAVPPPEIEKGIDRLLLQNLSERSGGQYYSIDGLEKFQPPKKKEFYTVKKLDLNYSVIYLLIFLALAIDWFLRRKEGTL